MLNIPRELIRQLAEVERTLYNTFMFTVYAIYNKKHDKVYIGQTVDIDDRIHQHNIGAFKNSYTSRFTGKWIIIYQEECPDRSSVLKREKQIKSYQGRQFIKNNIPR